MTQALPSAIQQAAGADSNLRVGIVQAVDSASTITVNIGGGIISDMPFLASYSPAVGDNVSIARFNATWLALGIVGEFRAGQVMAGVRTSTTPTPVTTSSTTEADIPFLANVTPRTFLAGHAYEFFARFITQQSVATDIFQFRCRRDTALTGTEMAFQRFSNNKTTGSWAQSMQFMFEETFTEPLSLFWSVVQVTGTGTITITPATNAATYCYWRAVDLGFNSSISGSPWDVTI